MPTIPSRSRTLRQRTTGNPLDPNDAHRHHGQAGRAGGCGRVDAADPGDRRTYNLPLAFAWDRIDEDVEHAIPKAALRGAHKGNERLSDTIRRMKAAQVEVRIIRDGKRYLRIIHLLGTVDRPEDEDEDGNVYYSFPADMREIMQKSDIFARLQTEVMFCFTSKYALALYEMIQKRGNLKHKNTDEFAPDDFRELLRVPNGKLMAFDLFRRFACSGGGGGQRVVGPHGPARCSPPWPESGQAAVDLVPKDEQGLKCGLQRGPAPQRRRKARINGLS